MWKVVGQQGEHMEEKGYGLGIEEQRVWCGADQVGSWEAAEVSHGRFWILEQREP